METIYFPGTENSIKPHQAVAATIGFFDGLHLGHRHLISMLKKIAEERQMASAVVTFECHPRQVLGSDWQPQLLTTLE